jgi:Domain of unknown function (DUF4177)
MIGESCEYPHMAPDFCLQLLRGSILRQFVLRRKIMQKWEYKVIHVRKQQVLKENYQMVKAYQSFDIVYLNELGAGGWELISCDVDHEDVGKPATMIFKRPAAGLSANR